MSTLFKNGAVAEDTWVTIEGEQPIPNGSDVIVSLDVFKANRDTLLARNDGRVGVFLEPLEPIEDIADDLSSLALVSLNFPSFADGTSFSKARLLRDRHGFEGEVRAVGDIRIDQLAFFKRCGCDALLVTHRPTIDAIVEGKDPSIHLYYQPALQDAATNGGKKWTRRSA